MIFFDHFDSDRIFKFDQYRRLDFRGLYTFYRRVQGYLCRGLLLVFVTLHEVSQSLFLLSIIWAESSSTPSSTILKVSSQWVVDGKISQFDWPTGDTCTSFHGKQISVHTRELAPKTDSCNRFAPGACSLISNQFDMREQNTGAKVLLHNIFSLEIVGADEGALLRERVAGACCGGKLPRVTSLHGSI